MKKNILKVTLVAAFALIVGYNTLSLSQKSDSSALVMSNIDAIAGGESDSDCASCDSWQFGICKDWGWGGCMGIDTNKYI